MDDINEFFAEHDKRMNIPDEDVDEYIQTRFAATRKYQSTEEHVAVGVTSHVSINSRKQHERSSALNTARKNGSSEIANVGNESKPSSTIEKSTPAAECCTKWRKTIRENSVSKQLGRVLHPRPSDNPILDASTSRITARRSGVTSADPIEARLSRQVCSGRTGPNSMSSSTDLAPVCGRDPKMRFVQAQIVQTANQAVPVRGEVTGYSTYASTAGSEMKAVQALKRQKLDAPPVSMPDNPPVMEVFSLPSASSLHNTAVFSSTAFDGHGLDGSWLPKNPAHSSPAGGIPNVASTAIPTVIASSSSRPTDNSHATRCTGEGPVPRTPAGFNTAAYLDVSNITSPADTLPRPTRNASGDAHAPSTEVQPSSPNILTSKELKARKTVNSDRRLRKAPRNGSSSKRVKDKPKLITPLEYAQKLQSCLDLRVKTNYLKGKRIFYVGGDMMYAGTTTRGRMEYIVKHGGTLVPKYDPAVLTHIVTDAGVGHTLRALSLKSLSDIPDHIPTVTWDWIVSGYIRASKRKSKLSSDSGDKGKGGAEGDHDDEDSPFDFEFMHAAFPERMDAGCSWKNMGRSKQRGKVAHNLMSGADTPHDDSGDVSHISTFSQESESTQTRGRGVSLTVLPPLPLDFKVVDGGKTEAHAVEEEREKPPENDDPLSEYYAQARADREAQWNRDASESDEGEDNIGCHLGRAPRRGFACDIKEQKPMVCVNQHIVDKLEELKELHKAKSSEEDRWRAFSYGKCIPAIRNYPKPIKSFSEARSIRGVGEKTALKIMEIINTGDLKRIKYESTEDVTTTKTFQGIYGVGRHTAFAWFASGLRTLDDVRARKGGLKLSTAQEIGLKFYDDINSRMPREEARRLFEMIKPIALDIDSKLFIEIMGSYRRGKVDCGDIDILISRPTTDGKTHEGVLRTLLERLHTAGIITEDLAVPEDFSDLELVYRGLCKLPEPGAKRRRIDFLCVPWASRGAALLYYTGDDIFNRAMRLKARKHGYSLNQRGLYSGVVRDSHDRQKKVCQGHVVASETEEEIFKILGVPWQEPHERVRG